MKAILFVAALIVSASTFAADTRGTTRDGKSYETKLNTSGIKGLGSQR